MATAIIFTSYIVNLGMFLHSTVIAWHQKLSCDSNIFQVSLSKLHIRVLVEVICLCIMHGYTTTSFSHTYLYSTRRLHKIIYRRKCELSIIIEPIEFLCTVCTNMVLSGLVCACVFVRVKHV